MDKTYHAQTIEANWRQHWEEKGYFKPSNKGNPYGIVLPPPNVTGRLHMGHGFQMTIMDILIRYHRMLGENTLWQAGTDHAGIATQMVVERQLAQEGKSRKQLGREAFIERVRSWQAQSGGTITEQMRRLGVSTDWSRECFSLDAPIATAVYTTFNKLYEDGLLYRGNRLVNWDPKLQTAISDLEVVNKTKMGHLWHIRYPLVDQDSYIVVATSRPETLFGDVAVAVSKDDPRYKHLIGNRLQLPLCERSIPIIADDMVDPEFGSGCVKITPAHDFHDHEVGQRHKLPLINILDKKACLNENVPPNYQKLDRFVARKQVVEELEKQGLIESVDEYQQTLPYGDRSDVVLEPLCTQQWFVNMKPLAEKAMAGLDKGELKFYPDNWKNTYLRWLEDIQDWCISRQLWWGHRIPAWYDKDGNIYIARNKDEAYKRYQLDRDIELQQDEDVLDTWFSAALWPFATLGWPDNSPDIFKTFYPTNTLVTGFDIIFFWVARMVMLGYYCTGKCPFKEVYITGLIRDQDGQKMSKSKGNVIDPIDLIDGIDEASLIEKRTRNMMQPEKAKRVEKATAKQFPQGIPSFGTDALRFTFCALASTGRDIKFDLERISGYRNFCNKIWNAARYVFMQTENIPIAAKIEQKYLTLAEKWIGHRFHETICEAKKHLANYRFDLLAQEIYTFMWNDFCDWYLELSKVNLQEESTSEEIKAHIGAVLLQVLENSLRLMHPIMPFISEEIWQKCKSILGITGETIMLQNYPHASDFPEEKTALLQMEKIQNIITACRTMRAEINLKPSQQIDLYIKCPDKGLMEMIEEQQHYLHALAKVKKYTWITESSIPQNAMMSTLEDITLFIPLEGLIDPDAEIKRLQKKLSSINNDIARCKNKLANKNYINKAPAQVISKEQEKLKDFRSQEKRLQEQITNLQQMGK